MPSHPVSLRKTREALSKTIDASNAHAARLNELLQHAQTVERRTRATDEKLDALLERGFFGRLKWLATGK